MAGVVGVGPVEKTGGSRMSGPGNHHRDTRTVWVSECSPRSLWDSEPHAGASQGQNYFIIKLRHGLPFQSHSFTVYRGVFQKFRDVCYPNRQMQSQI